MMHARTLLPWALAIGALSGCSDEATEPTPSDSPPLFATTGGGVTATNLNVSGRGADSRANDINDQGRIVGWKWPWTGQPSAFVWTPTSPKGAAGTFAILNTLGGEAMAYGINASGHVVGMSRAGSAGLMRAVLWSPSAGGGYGAPLDLGSAPGVNGGFAFAIGDFSNGSARVVGSTDVTNKEEALLWTVTNVGGSVSVGSAVLLGDLGQGSSARGVNSAGLIVGYIHVGAPSGSNKAALWTPSSGSWTMTQLLPGSPQSIAWGINAAGYIVGEDQRHPFVRSPLGTITPLPMPGYTMGAAFGINDAGEIAGYVASTAKGRAALWLPGPTGYVLKVLGKTAGGIGYGLNEPIGGVTEVAGSSTASFSEHAVLWTVR